MANRSRCFFQVGGFLFQNNLPANAHGNGYADPNVIIPIAIETVETDGGAFNVREGNNSVNSAIIFGLRDRLDPVIRLSADYRDVNLVTAGAPRIRPTNCGSGLSSRMEWISQALGAPQAVQRECLQGLQFRQARLHGLRHRLLRLCFPAGLIPIGANIPDDTYDARQREETSHGALILNDIWHLTERSQFQFSGSYRYYTLDVRPNFGDGWIRQSEHRNVNSEDVLYSHSFSKAFSLMAGVDLRREAPRALDLDRANDAGIFQPVTGNNITVNFLQSYVAADGTLLRILHTTLLSGDEVSMDNRDLYRGPSFSFPNTRINSPKGRSRLLPPDPCRGCLRYR